MSLKIKVLIVDDDYGMTETMKDVLEDLGYEVEVALDFQTALAAVWNPVRQFDVLLMDIKMPGQNGVETLKRMKAIHPDLKILMMTAYTDQDLIDEAVSSGAIDVLHKPLDIDRVIDFLDSLKHKKTVLVIDDDSKVIKLFEKCLEGENLSVSYAHSGEAGLDLVKRQQFQVAFIDMLMPGMNGIETYKAIRKISPEITCIMMTGYPEETGELFKEAKNGRIHACLYKPLDMKKIVTLIERICR